VVAVVAVDLAQVAVQEQTQEPEEKTLTAELELLTLEEVAAA
jgi:hypothetical protein